MLRTRSQSFVSLLLSPPRSSSYARAFTPLRAVFRCRSNPTCPRPRQAATMGSTTAASEVTEFWLYGYGSLIWKPPPHFDRRIPGWVNGYVRRFWQASEDHRGTPEAPGRVVTLIERSFWEELDDHHNSAPEKVWGVAYRIKPESVAEVKEYLDIREINGYTIHYTPFQPADGSATIQTLVYIGTPDNEQFVGVQDPQKLAEHIFKSEGPSGLNKDYLLSLDVALNELTPESGDVHIHDLAERVRALERKEVQSTKS